jgi:hypothetical protein
MKYKNTLLTSSAGQIICTLKQGKKHVLAFRAENDIMDISLSPSNTYNSPGDLSRLEPAGSVPDFSFLPAEYSLEALTTRYSPQVAATAAFMIRSALDESLESYQPALTSTTSQDMAPRQRTHAEKERDTIELVGRYISEIDSLMSEDHHSEERIVADRITKGYVLHADLASFTRANLQATRTQQALDPEYERAARAEEQLVMSDGPTDQRERQTILQDIFVRFRLLAREVAGGVSRIASVAQTASILTDIADLLGLTVVLTEGDSVGVYGDDLQSVLVFAHQIQSRFESASRAKGFQGLLPRIGISEISDAHPLIVYRDSKSFVNRTNGETHKVIYAVEGTAVERAEELQKKASTGQIVIPTHLLSQVKKLATPENVTVVEGTHENGIESCSLQLSEAGWRSLNILIEPNSNTTAFIREVVLEMPIAYGILHIGEVTPEHLGLIRRISRECNLHCLKLMTIKDGQVPVMFKPTEYEKGSVEMMRNLKLFARRCRELGLRGVICASKGPLCLSEIARRADVIGPEANKVSRGPREIIGRFGEALPEEPLIYITNELKQALFEEGYRIHSNGTINVSAKGYTGKVPFHHLHSVLHSDRGLLDKQIGLGEVSTVLDLLAQKLQTLGIEQLDANEIVDRIASFAGLDDRLDNDLLKQNLDAADLVAESILISTDRFHDVILLANVVHAMIANKETTTVTSILLKLSQYVYQLNYPNRVINSRLTQDEREALRKMSAITFGVDDHPLRIETAIKALKISRENILALEAKGFLKRFVGSGKSRQIYLRLKTPFASFFDSRLPQDIRETVHADITLRLLDDCKSVSLDTEISPQDYFRLRSLALHYIHTGNLFLDHLGMLDLKRHTSFASQLVSNLRTMFTEGWNKRRYVDLATVGLKLAEAVAVDTDEADDILYKVAYSHMILGNAEQADEIQSMIRSKLSETQIRDLEHAKQHRGMLYQSSIATHQEQALARGK